MIEVSPEGFEEIAHADDLELVGVRGRSRARPHPGRVPRGNRSAVRIRLAGRLARLPPPCRRGRRVDRPAVGAAARRSAGGGDRPRTSLRYRSASHDATLRRPARGSRAWQRARRGVRLGRARDRGGEARLHARDRNRRRPGCCRGDGRQRRAQPRRARRAASPMPCAMPCRRSMLPWRTCCLLRSRRSSRASTPIRWSRRGISPASSPPIRDGITVASIELDGWAADLFRRPTV